ncbi:hypothetical protein [Polaribacter sp.]|uniref:hypothetical protein n=1 Tax=Polaribacter sp. TaxID=1920175 RepID=UPI003F6B9533
MMKIFKILFFLFIFSFSISLNAQKAEKKAEKFTARITKALDLSKADQKKVYKIQVERFNEGKEIRQKYKDDDEAKKEALKNLGKKVYNQMKNALGKEQIKKWKAYRKSKKN